MGLLIGGSLAGVRVSFLAGARSSDFGPMFGSRFLAENQSDVDPLLGAPGRCH